MKVLFIAVHPDDETLGCGGTILKHKNQGDDIFWLIFTSVSESLGYPKEFVKKREKQIEKVSQAYQFQKTYNLEFSTTRLHMIDFNEMLSKMSSVIKEIKPEIIYTNNRSDIHSDHKIAAKVVMSCTKSFRNPFIRRILMYECISETETSPPFPENMFIPNVYSDISAFINQKVEIMKFYESELQKLPFPRSIDNIIALARFRGSTIAVKYAEAFMLVRDLF